MIVTVPLPLLRDVEIYPELSADKQKLVAELPYFEATRILVQTYSRFWHDTGLSGYARTDQPAEVWDCTYDLPGRSGILGATVGGEIGKRLLTVSPEVAVSRGRDIVSGPFPQLLRQTQTVVAHRWALEPWSKGAFAVFHPGQMTTMMPARLEARRAPALRRRTHLVLDGMDGRCARVRRTSGARSPELMEQRS